MFAVARILEHAVANGERTPPGASRHFIGINGISPKHTQQLIAEWQRWSKEAGFGKVTAIR
jgi:hypothetical protein